MKEMRLKRLCISLFLMMAVLFAVFLGGWQAVIVKAEDVFQVKEVLFTVAADYNGKPAYVVTIEMEKPFPLPGQTNLQWAGSGDESFRENVVINGYTVGEIESFNSIALQAHRYTTNIVIYIYDAFGNLPCGEHATNAECTCTDKRPILTRDGSDEILFKAGLTTGGLAASTTDSLWRMKDGLSWSEVHTLTHHAAKAATCTEEGNTEYWSCEVCGKYFSDAEGTAEIADKASVTVAAQGHRGGTASCTEQAVCEVCGEKYGALAAHTLTHHAAEAATCTEAGNAEYWSCEVCGKYFSDAEGKNEIDLSSTVLSPVGHDYVDGECSVCGAQEPGGEESGDGGQTQEPGGEESGDGEQTQGPGEEGSEGGCGGAIAGSFAVPAAILLIGAAVVCRKKCRREKE